MLLYTTDVVNAADAAAVGLAMAEQIRDDLTSHAAWVLTEEFTATDQQWYVFKCLATESGLVDDYFVVLNRRISTGELRFGLCEDYDSSTNTMSHFSNQLSGSQVPFDAQGRTAGTIVLGTAQLSACTFLQWVPSGTSTKWWLIVAEDGFTVAFNGAANAFVHIGSYEPLTPLAIDLPIQIIGSSSGAGGITRNPSAASITTYDVALSVEGGGSTNINGPLLGFRGRLDIDDKLQGPGRPVSEQGIQIYNWLTNGEPLIGWALGKQKRMRVGKNPPGSFAWGDAYSMDGTLWVPYLPTDHRIWDTGVPA